MSSTNDMIEIVKDLLFKNSSKSYKNLVVYSKNGKSNTRQEMIARYQVENSEHEAIIKLMDEGWVLVVDQVSQIYPAYIYGIGGKKWGYINNQGEFLIKPQFNSAENFVEGLAIVSVNNVYGIINEEGKFIIEPKYDSITSIKDERIIAMKNKGFIVLDTSGKQLTHKPYQYIGSYVYQRAIVSDISEQGEYLYGYIDDNGNEIIPIQYKEANDFVEHYALVKDKNDYHLINTFGEVVKTYPFPFVGNLGEHKLSFMKENGGKYGYIDIDGKILIEPQFTGVSSFNHNRAIINRAQDIENQFGLIDDKNNIVIEPIYNMILDLGEKRYAVGKAISKEKPYLGSMYAIFNSDGQQLTEFKFHDVSNYQNNIASVQSLDKTFFINLNGKVDLSYPVIQGLGTMRLINDIIQVNIDLQVYYISRNKEIIYYPNIKIPLNKDQFVLRYKYKPSHNYLIYYPQMNTEYEWVNLRLKKLSKVKEVKPVYDYTYQSDFIVIFYKERLLELEIEGYEFTLGAAHGVPLRTYIHLDLMSHQFYELGDLFKNGIDYQRFLEHIIHQLKETNKAYPYILSDADFTINKDTLFYVTQEELHILYPPYQVAAYAAGFVEFTIPFLYIIDLIDTQGSFWKSFNN